MTSPPSAASSSAQAQADHAGLGICAGLIAHRGCALDRVVSSNDCASNSCMIDNEFCGCDLQ